MTATWSERIKRIVNPPSAQSRQQVLVTLASSVFAVFVALGIGSLILLVSGEKSTALFSTMWDHLRELPALFRGDWAGSTHLLDALERSTPLMIAAVAVAIGFKMNLFNIGVEGQFLIGVFFAAWYGQAVDLPAPLHVLSILAVAMTTAALWAAIPAALKVRRGVNEVIVTIMLNNLALNLIDFLFGEYARFTQEGGSLDVKTKPLPQSGWMPDLVKNRLNSFFLVALLVAFLYWLLVFKSRFGYRLRASGLNAGAARTGGIASGRMIASAMVIGGAIAGLVGMTYLLGGSHAYGPSRPDGYGFDGIAVALLGRNHPAGIVVSAMLFGFLNTLTGPLQIDKVPQSIVIVVQAIILLSVVIVNEIVSVRVNRRTADRTAAELASASASAGAFA
jgi:simple sugar transport system permease protein